MADFKVLIVDDEKDLAELIDYELRDRGFDTIVKFSVTDSILELKENAEIKVIVSDYRLKDGTGEDLLKEVVFTGHLAKMILTSGYSDLEFQDNVKGQLFKVMTKPVDYDELETAIREAANS